VALGDGLEVGGVGWACLGDNGHGWGRSPVVMGLCSAYAMI
jgi:hypothetical protein